MVKFRDCLNYKNLLKDARLLKAMLVFAVLAGAGAPDTVYAKKHHSSSQQEESKAADAAETKTENSDEVSHYSYTLEELGVQSPVELHTVDGRRNLTFSMRNDDVITSGGYRIGPAEIEARLIRHPAVALAAAVGSSVTRSTAPRPSMCWFPTLRPTLPPYPMVSATNRC